jgi:hypothetical protein
MEAAFSSGASVAFQRNTRRYIPEDRTQHKDSQLAEVQHEMKEPKKATKEKSHCVIMRYYDAHNDEKNSNYIQCQCLKHRGRVASKSNRGYETKRMQGDMVSPGIHLQGVRKTTNYLIQDTRVSRSWLDY